VSACVNHGKTPESVSPEPAGGLPRLEGIDVQTGLSGVNNDWKLYLKLLFNFHNRHRNIKEEIRTELEDGSLDVARRLAHTIKGVAGTVGANRLSEIASRLESAIKNEDSDRIPDLLENFNKEVARVMAALDTFIKNEDARRTEAAAGSGGVDIPLEAARLKKLFQELSDLTDKRDSDVIKLVAEIKALLGPSNISDNFLKMESHINSFQFEHAKEALEHVTEELNL
jgi:HPt (histidine-containing phosphotransfer) domain-containing protein